VPEKGKSGENGGDHESIGQREKGGEEDLERDEGSQSVAAAMYGGCLMMKGLYQEAFSEECPRGSEMKGGGEWVV